MTQQASPSGVKILERALDRNLDGEFDRMTSIMLDLLMVPETRKTAQEMIQALFSQSRKKNCEEKVEIPYPSSTLALIAEMNFPAQHSDILWQAIPKSKKLSFIIQVLGNALLNNSVEWMEKSMSKIDELRKTEPWHFSDKNIGRACLGVVDELRSFYAQDAISIQELTPSWTPCLTWTLERILKAPPDEIFQDLNIGTLEWVSSIIPDCVVQTHPQTYSNILALDNGQCPGLLKIVTKSRLEGLMDVAKGEQNTNPTTPQM